MKTLKVRRGEDLITLELRFPYGDKSTAKSVLWALGPESKGFLETRLEGNTIIYSLKAESAGSLRNTANDLLACIKAAEESVALASESHGTPKERL